MARPSGLGFWAGFFSMFTWHEDFDEPSASLRKARLRRQQMSPEEATQDAFKQDAEAIAGDWERVGGYLRSARSQVEAAKRRAR